MIDEVICNYDVQECEKCSRTNCIVKSISNCVVSVRRVPELEKMINQLAKGEKK